MPKDANIQPASLAWFAKSTLPYMPLVLEVMLIAAVTRLLGLVQPFVFQTIIDRVLPFQREASLMLIVVILLVTMVFSVALDAISGYLGNHMGNQLTADLAARIFRHVLSLPLQFLQRWPVGEMLARIAEIDVVRGFLTGTVASVVLDVLFAIIYVAALLALSPTLTVVVLIALPLQILTFSVLGPFLRSQMQKAFFADAFHQARLVEVLGNFTTVKALGSEHTQDARLKDTLLGSLRQGFRVTKLNIVSGGVQESLGTGTGIAIIFFGAQLVFANTISLGELIAFHMLSEKVSGPIMSLSTIWQQWLGLKVARQRLGDLLNEPEENEGQKPVLELPGAAAIQVNDVWFGYEADRFALQGLTCEIEAGRPTLIIGPSGCGKSTLAKVICDLYRPAAGSVLVDGRDLSQFDPISVRQRIAYIPQEPVLFSGSIRENLLMANPAATSDELEWVLKATASDSFVKGFAQGLDQQVGERGGFLSGGQRQRLAIARALLSKPAIMVLDEPTSALDEEAADAIVTTLAEISRLTTTVVITHKHDLLGNDVAIIDLAQQGNAEARQAHG